MSHENRGMAPLQNRYLDRVKLLSAVGSKKALFSLNGHKTTSL